MIWDATRPVVDEGQNHTPGTRGLTIVNADLGLSDTSEVSVTEDGTVTAVGERVSKRGDVIIDAGGAAVLPAFTDHHLHLHALAARDHSVSCRPPDISDYRSLARALASSPGDPHGWVRGVGYHDDIAGPLDRRRLDDLHGDRPVRIEDRSGALWTLNSEALRRSGIVGRDHPGVEVDGAGDPTGRIWRADGWLRDRLPTPVPPPLADVGAELRRLGIAEITDATPDLDDRQLDALVDAVDIGHISGRLTLLGVRLGHGVDHPRISVGPYKIVVADSDIPAPADLAEVIGSAHAADRSVAVHCVTDVALAVLIAALRIVGIRPGDRIEHAGVVPESAIAALATMGVGVVTQPGFLADRGDDFLAHSDPVHRDDLYRCGTLLAAGVPVALSSDAPYGPLDPWETIRSAATRRTRSGRAVGASGDRLGVRNAIAAHCAPASRPWGPSRAIGVGRPAHLQVLDRSLHDLYHDPIDAHAVATVIDGRLVWTAD